MKEGPSGSAIRSLIPSHRELLRSKAVVVSVAETSGMIPSGKVERGERKQTASEASKADWRCQNRGAPVRSKNSSEAPPPFTLPPDGNNARVRPVARGIE